jgi:hypothetical protein
MVNEEGVEEEEERRSCFDNVRLANQQFEKVIIPVVERVNKEFDEENVVTEFGLISTSSEEKDPEETETRANVGLPVKVKEQKEREREDPEEERV